MTLTTNHRDNHRRTTLPCLHCGHVLRVRSNREITPTSRELYMICVNEDCGATFGALLSIQHQISPGAAPSPTVHLRTAPPRQRPANDPGPRRLGGQEVPPRPSNDDQPMVATG